MMGTPKVGRTEMYRVAAGEIQDGRMITRAIDSSPVRVPARPPGKQVIYCHLGRCRDEAQERLVFIPMPSPRSSGRA